MELEFAFKLLPVQDTKFTEYVFYVRENIDFNNNKPSWIPAFSWVARYGKTNTLGHLEAHLINLKLLLKGENSLSSGFFGDGGFEYHQSFLKLDSYTKLETKPFWGCGFMVEDGLIYWIESVFGQKVHISSKSLESLIKCFERAILVTD